MVTGSIPVVPFLPLDYTVTGLWSWDRAPAVWIGIEPQPHADWDRAPAVNWDRAPAVWIGIEPQPHADWDRAPAVKRRPGS